MGLHPVKIFRPDKKGNLKLVKVVSRKELQKLADEKLINQQKWKKQRAKS